VTLAILAFLFAMQSCEYSSTVPNPGKTKKINVSHVIFRDKRKRILPADCTIQKAAYIMIFGRWSSDAFLVYIHPQVLEWTNNMSRDMICHDSFLDATDTRRTHCEDPRVRQQPFNGPSILMPRLHLFH
jgi:hypothetical protein